MDLAAKIVSSEFPPEGSERRAELTEAFWNSLLHLPGRKSAEMTSPQIDRFLSALLKGFFEIQSAYFNIVNARAYFRGTPRGFSNRRSTYLSFVVHAYLNEIYVVEERMKVYLTTLQRASARGSETRIRLERVKPILLDVVEKAFSGVRQVRCAHVHQQRFSDDGLERLSTFELLNQTRDPLPTLGRLYRLELQRVRKYWDEKFTTNETALQKLMELFYDAILGAILESDGSFRSYR